MKLDLTRHRGGWVLIVTDGGEAVIHLIRSCSESETATQRFCKKKQSVNDREQSSAEQLRSEAQLRASVH